MKDLKYIILIIVVIVTIVAFQPMCYAEETGAGGQNGKTNSSNKVNGDDVKATIIPVINILTSIGIIVLVAVTIVMGIKYLFASPEQAAKLKTQLIGLAISAFVILGATAIWKIVYKVISSTNL